MHAGVVSIDVVTSFIDTNLELWVSEMSKPNLRVREAAIVIMQPSSKCDEIEMIN